MEKWVIINKKADFTSIAKQCNISEITAKCLVNKGITEPHKIMEYLYPDKEDFHNPFLLKDMKKAVAILKDKIAAKKKIRIIGDYDVDGVVSTFILYRTLTMLGAYVDYEIPDRIKDGYGINITMVEAAHKEGVDTLLTCDNGIVALEQTLQAKAYGMTVIITDHHNLMETEEGIALLPEADAIINPKQPGCNYPYPGLCGAAITYKLSMALLRDLECLDKEEFQEELLSYTSIATVCDVMDLTGENRIIVKHGLELIKKTKNRGLKALMLVSGIETEQLSTFHLGFVIGPCLNASGRLNTAKKGLELLLSKEEEEALRLAGEVKDLNNLRKNMTAENVEKAITLIKDSSLINDKVLVVYLPDCHESIAGIIAGRVREQFHKPAIILTDAQECVKGSARSIEQYNMIEELSKCRDILIKVGGHPMAAGLSLSYDKVDLLRRRLNEMTHLTEEMLVPKVAIDIQLPFTYLSYELIKELRLLEPFGKGNEKPLFAEKDLSIKAAYILGKNGSGIRLQLTKDYKQYIEALYFGDVKAFFEYIKTKFGEQEAENLRTGKRTEASLTITYYPKVNEYNGYKSIQLMIQNYR